MTAGAAPGAGRRAGLGVAAVLAGFLLLAPPLYLLGPFALLTLVSRPRTGRELLWLIAAGTGIAATIIGGTTLVPQLIRTSGLLVSVAFVILSLRGALPVLSRALLGVAIAALGVGIWASLMGLGWTDIQGAFTEMMRATYKAWAEATGPESTRSLETQALIQQLQDVAPKAASLVPGLLALEAIAGCALAWAWHHRIARSPRGVPPSPFREFRFNDHLVWGAIFTLGSLLLPLPPLARTFAANLLIVWVGLYVARGLAVIAAILAPAPSPLKIIAAGLAFLLAPFTPGICVVLGLADTWLDIRGRLRPPAPRGA